MEPYSPRVSWVLMQPFPPARVATVKSQSCWVGRRRERLLLLLVQGASLVACQAKKAKALKVKPQKPKPLKPQTKRNSPSAVPVCAPEDIFSLDVECVAVGKTHEKSDRMPCSYALVDGHGACVKRTLIQPSRNVVSYLTPFTGLRPGDLDSQNALSIDRARRELQELLPRRAILVGQEPQGDIEWMSLREGQDFTGSINLSEVFTNDKGMVFSLRHEARVLLGREPDSSVHDPCWDAKVSIELYRLASAASPKELAALREKLTKKEFWPPKPSLAKQCGYQLDGVCLSMYGAEHCICGRPVVMPNKH